MKLLAALFVIFANAEEGITGPRFYQTLLDDYPGLGYPMADLLNHPYPVTAEVIASVFLGGALGFQDYVPEQHYDDLCQMGGMVARIERMQLPKGSPQNVEIADVITDIYETQQYDLFSAVILYKPLIE